ncbi:MAG: sulfur oxidation c-type cytochrome SoxX [Ideonella sp.]|nr:sulfur oxidation c-type cytochrome SoxX [Ideonella sp.]
MKTKNLLLSGGAVALLAACGSMGGVGGGAAFPTAEQAVASSWQNMQPGWEKRLVQDDTQKVCSAARDKPNKADAERVEKMNAAMKVVYPASGKLVGDWKKGEAIAQSGYGLRVGDNNPKREPGGNCYACHQMDKKELSFGTLGPGLNQYGKLRGNSEAIVKYTYDKIYNSQAFSACSNMPRFGHNGILKPEQIADLVGLLMDPASPVNQ